MYSRVCLLCIIVTLSLGHVASKAGVEENDKIFSLNFEVINPRDKNCELMGNTSKCDVELSAESSMLEYIADGFKYLAPIKIGEQLFKVHLDTGSNTLWVISDLCKKLIKDHTTYHLDPKHLTNYKQFKFDYIGGGVAGYLVEEDVQVTKTFVLKKQLLGAANRVKIPIKDFDGVMGLNMDISDGHPSVFYTMMQDKLIKEPIYSIYLKGGKSSKQGGVITFGGHRDKLLVENSGIKTPMIPDKGRILIIMTSLSLDKKVFCSDKVKRCRVLVDSGDSHVYGPKEFVDKINKVLKPMDHDEIDCKNVKLAPTIEIMFGKQRMTLEPTFYTFKFHTGKCYTLVFEVPDQEHDFLFGVPFFVKYYIEFNFTNKQESITFWTKK